MRAPSLRLRWATLLLLVIVGCGGETLHSQWLEREISIDGDPSEWRGALHWIEKSELDVGLLNDAEQLYICLIVGRETDRHQIMARGMTLWLDAPGQEGKRIGIRYPVGFSVSELGPAELRAMEEAARERQREGDHAPRPRDDLASRFEGSLGVLEILHGENASPERLAPDVVPGLEIAVRANSSSLVYELALPLRGDSRIALGAEPGTRLGARLVTPEIDLKALQDRMQGGEGLPPGGAMGGGGGMSGRPPAGRMLPPEALDLKADLQLAEPPQSSS